MSASRASRANGGMTNQSRWPSGQLMRNFPFLGVLATAAYGKILQPPNKDWKQTNPYLTDAAATALTAACGTTVAAGQPLPTNTVAGAPCADEILSIYDNETTRGGQAAFTAANARQYEP